MLLGEWPVQLVKDIARRRVVLVLGAGVSKHAIAQDGVTRPPLWKEFLNKAIESIRKEHNVEHIEAAVRDGDLLHACEWLHSKMDENWASYLRAQFVFPKFTAGELHELIALLDARIVFSLNFDDIYEIKSREINESSQFIKYYYDSDICEFLRGDARYIVKVHGGMSSAANIIFTQRQYAEARVKHSLFYSAFDAALMSHSFLFIGCGYGDPDLNLLLENQAFKVPTGINNPHYFLTDSNLTDDLKNSLRHNRNLKTLMYEKVDDGHSGLVAAMRDLQAKVLQERSMLIETTNW